MGALRSGREISRAPIASIPTLVAGGGNASDARGVRHRNGIVLHNEKGPPAMTSGSGERAIPSMWLQMNVFQVCNGRSRLALLWQIFSRHGIPKSLFL